MVNSLRHHSDPNVAALARELVATFRAECQKQWKQRKEMKATEKLNDRTNQMNQTNPAIAEPTGQTEPQDLVRSSAKKGESVVDHGFNFKSISPPAR